MNTKIKSQELAATLLAAEELNAVVGGGLIDIGAGLVAAAATKVVGGWGWGGGGNGTGQPGASCGAHRICIL
jgi:hypothetical protein